MMVLIKSIRKALAYLEEHSSKFPFWKDGERWASVSEKPAPNELHSFAIHWDYLGDDYFAYFNISGDYLYTVHRYWGGEYLDQLRTEVVQEGE